MDKPTFQIKKETRPVVLNAIRVSNRVYEAIEELARKHAITQGDVVRQMIEFAIEHMEPTNE